MTIKYTYGLELTNNSKVGWAFSLPRSKTCVGATAICKKLCYGNGIRYQSEGQKDKRERNLRTVELLLSEGGPELLAENLVLMIDQARPRDWLTARVTGCKTIVPWTIRIHDIGDFHSVDYAQAWILALKARPECVVWFYTRSFAEGALFDRLTELASLPNCQGWLSADSDNYTEAIIAKCKNPGGVWKLALLQDKDLDAVVLPTLAEGAGPAEIVNFPYHRGGKHVVPIKQKGVIVCPAIDGKYKLEASNSVARPCQVCAFCLP